MKILSALQIRSVDQLTISMEPISSIDLMERAATRFTDWFIQKFPDTEKKIYIFCGMGNNGGDGLVVARLLHQKFYNVVLFVCKIAEQGSPDFQTNLNRLPPNSELPYFLANETAPFPEMENGIIIDAIFGSGLNRPIDAKWIPFFKHLNQQQVPIVSIDIPSGVFADQETTHTSLQATYTVSFELPKLAFLLPENANRIGKWETVSIDLHRSALEEMSTNNYFLTQSISKNLLQARAKFDHKGSYGHGLIVAGSKGKIGAALLATKACLRTGAGLVTAFVPECGYQILQQAAPEAMVITDADQNIITPFVLEKTFSAIGIGPGIGTAKETRAALIQLINSTTSPMVLDADALNILSTDRSILKTLPANSILTPHPGEFKRLFGEYANDFQRLEAMRDIANDLNCILILKGAHTCITTPQGDCYFNSTGNPGMATGGSGDVLTGMLTALLAQGYSPMHASLLGVYLHGLSGDIAAKKTGSMESLIAGDLINYIGQAFNTLRI